MNDKFIKSIRLGGEDLNIFSLKSLETNGIAKNLSRLPVSIRVVLESLLRNLDNKKVSIKDIERLANYNAKKPGGYEVPFTVARIVLQDFTGVPLLVDLAAMRDAAKQNGSDPSVIEPLVPVDLVVDHSVQVDFSGFSFALERNMDLEFIRNRERYEFLKWGQQAFETFNVVPPGIGIVHQVNLEYLAKGVLLKDGFCYPDTLVGTDSHTTMINGLGVVGWGVGGIEAEAGMLGQPIAFQVPEVIGVELKGKIPEGVTATDMVLKVTEMLREYGVVGKFVEFFGDGTESLSVPDRATIANMAPEYGATMGFFPVDKSTVEYYFATGRSKDQCDLIESYFKEQDLFGIPKNGEIDYTDTLSLDLSSLQPSLSGPKRPQDRINSYDIKKKYSELLLKSVSDGGFGLEKGDVDKEANVLLNNPVGDIPNKNFSNVQKKDYSHQELSLKNGSILIAAITSCTNTSNPSVMLAAGLVAKKANLLGLKLSPYVKASLAPGSRIVTDYLERTGLQDELDSLGFYTVGYGCTTCIGNSGPLDPNIEKAVKDNNLICASVLSGNRNFEARIHSAIKANFLMSPPLVVIFALAGRVDIDLKNESIGVDKDGNEVFLKDLWPDKSEIEKLSNESITREAFKKYYTDFEKINPKWNDIKSKSGDTYQWDKESTYIKLPPFFDDFSKEQRDIENINQARILGFFGDSVTTDHISPAGAIPVDSPAGKYLVERNVEKGQFNSFGSRRGNDRVMTRGTFANVRIKNLMVSGSEGGVTRCYADGFIGDNGDNICSIFDASNAYRNENKSLIVIAGSDYGMESSRDWAAKGTLLLGVQAVVAKSYERIHRSNLIGMGVLPFVFKYDSDYEKLRSIDDVLLGKAIFSIEGLSNDLKPMSEASLVVTSEDGSEIANVPLVVRLDTPIEIDYYRNKGILHYVLKELI